MRIIEILASIAGLAMSFASYPQAFKIFKCKNASQVSLISYSIFFLGCLIWTVYGVVLRNAPILFGYVPGIFGNFLVILGILKYSKKTC